MENQFKVELNSETGFLPTCYPLLLSLKEGKTQLFYEEHSRRHPLAAYKDSLSRVENAFLFVLECYDKVALSKDLSWSIGELLESHRQLYYSLAEHFEACEGAAASLVPFSAKKKNPLLDPILRRAKDYKHVDLVINQVKHRHNNFVPIKFRSEYAYVYGFYVSGIRTSTSVGPNPEVHKKWNNQETAFSFNRDFRRLFVDIYRVGEYLAETLKGFGISSAQPKAVEGSKMLSIARKISDIPNFCFPDEVSQPNQIVSITSDNDRHTLRVARGLDRPQSTIPPGGNLRIESVLTIGIESTHIMPYLQNR
ncbi:hypothetical protein [Azospirillum argentinense]|uniref:hypothetical protein n=1 Tax=Azospirillum argentinense TaxID=2970906 RepID=UPI0010C08B36|nr:hypothetical protein [Azospirillum argentinense]